MANAELIKTTSKYRSNFGGLSTAKRRKVIGVVVICIIFLIGGITATSLINRSSNQQIGDKIDGQPIHAPQLGKDDKQWRNGYGTKSDGKDTNSENRPTRRIKKDAKRIIIYFSRSGSTELLASKVAKRMNTDILEIVVKDPYSGDYNSTLSRANHASS